MQGPSSATPAPAAPAASPGGYWRDQWQQFQATQPSGSVGGSGGDGRQSGGGSGGNGFGVGGSSGYNSRWSPLIGPDGNYQPWGTGTTDIRNTPGFYAPKGSGDPINPIYAALGAQTDDRGSQIKPEQEQSGWGGGGDWRAAWAQWRADHPRPATTQGDQVGDPARWQQLLSSGSYAALDPAAQSTLRSILGL